MPICDGFNNHIKVNDICTKCKSKNIVQSVYYDLRKCLKCGKTWKVIL